MAQAPTEAQQAASLATPEMDVIMVPDDEDQPGPSNWEEQGRKKKQKVMDIPQRAREQALQIVPWGSSYFDATRRNFLLQQATLQEKEPRKIDIEIRMLDDKVIQAKELLKHDAFIKYEEFKNFLYKIKQSELVLQLGLGDSEERITKLVNKLQDYDPSSENLTVDEARDLVRRRGMLLFPGWEINSSFLLDQIRRQDKALSFEEENPFGVIQGVGFLVDANTMAMWILAPKDNNPTLMEIKDSPQGSAIFWNVHQASRTQIRTLIQSAVSLRTSKMQILEEQLHNAYDKYVDVRKNYDEEMKRTYVLEQLNKGLESELKNLRTSAWPIIEVNDQGVQTNDVDVPLQIADKDYELNFSFEIERRTLRRMIAHKIDVLTLASQAIHHTFLALESSER